MIFFVFYFQRETWVGFRTILPQTKYHHYSHTSVPLNPIRPSSRLPFSNALGLYVFTRNTWSIIGFMDLLGAPPPSISMISLTFLNLNRSFGSQIRCHLLCSGTHISSQWYNTIYFGHKFSCICFKTLSQRSYTNEDIFQLINIWSSSCIFQCKISIELSTATVENHCTNKACIWRITLLT